MLRMGASRQSMQGMAKKSELLRGFEPLTYALRVRRSTD